MTSAFSWQNSISLCPASFCSPRPNLPVTPGVSWLHTFAFQSSIMKRKSFLVVNSRRSCRSSSVQFSSVQSFIRVQLFVTPWIAAHQASLSITNSWSLPKPMSIKSVMPSNHLVPFSTCPQSFPASGSFQMSQLFVSGGQSIGVSASTSVLPMNTQDWFPLGWTGWISLKSKGLSRVFSNTTVQSINSSVLSFLYSPTLTRIHDH